MPDEIDPEFKQESRGVPPSPLDYRPIFPQSGPNTSFAGQMFIGFCIWVGSVLVAVNVVRSRVLGYPSLQLVIAIGVIFLLLTSWWLYSKHRWTGFFPGLLLGLGLTCLVPMGIVWVICGGHL